MDNAWSTLEDLIACAVEVKILFDGSLNALVLGPKARNVEVHLQDFLLSILLS